MNAKAHKEHRSSWLSSHTNSRQTNTSISPLFGAFLFEFGLFFRLKTVNLGQNQNMEVSKNSNHDEIKDGFLGIISIIEAANSGSHDEHYILHNLLSSLKKSSYTIYISRLHIRENHTLYYLVKLWQT